MLYHTAVELYVTSQVPISETKPFIHFFIYLGFYVAFNTVQVITGSWKGRGNQYKQFIRVLYCKLPTNGKHLPAFPLEAVPRTKPQPQRWEARVLPLLHLDMNEYILHRDIILK